MNSDCAKEFSLVRRGIANPFSWNVPLAVGMLLSAALILFGAGTRYQFQFLLAALVVFLTIPASVITACFFTRVVRLNKHEYFESQTAFGWTLWAERYSTEEVKLISIEGLAWDDDRDVHQLTLNLTDGRKLPSFVFYSEAPALRAASEMNEIIKAAREESK